MTFVIWCSRTACCDTDQQMAYSKKEAREIFRIGIKYSRMYAELAEDELCTETFEGVLRNLRVARLTAEKESGLSYDAWIAAGKPPGTLYAELEDDD